MIRVLPLHVGAFADAVRGEFWRQRSTASAVAASIRRGRTPGRVSRWTRPMSHVQQARHHGET
nr:hypothetical protein JVH1_1062 [Rhodococcus sp. JVH1]